MPDFFQSQPAGSQLSVPQNVPDPPQPGGSLYQSDGSSPYARYAIKISYVDDQGKMQLPIGGVPGQSQATPCVIVDLHLPVSKVIVQWTATRMGIKPLVPSATPTNSNFVLLERRVDPESADFPSDTGNRIFQISGTYAYACKVPIDPATANLGIGNLPFDLSNQGDNRFVPADFSDQILAGM